VGVNPLELLSRLLVALLLVTASGQAIGTVGVVVDGTQTVGGDSDATIVAGGTASVPENASVEGAVYVVGGTLTVAGTVRGSVTQLGGNVTVRETGTVTERLRSYGPGANVSDGATVGTIDRIEPTTQTPSPGTDFAVWFVQALVVAAGAFVLSRRAPGLLDNVTDSIRHHTFVSLVVGALTGTTLLVLFVFMAFTVILIPVSVLGILAGLLSVAYAYVAFGHLLGTLVPVDRREVASAVGAVVFFALTTVLGWVPVVGGLIQLLLVVTGLGAVLVTYFGLSEFEPVTLPD
jgi:hypothetical protein